VHLSSFTIKSDITGDARVASIEKKNIIPCASPLEEVVFGNNLYPEITQRIEFK